MAFLDNDGVAYLWLKAKSFFAKASDVPQKSATTPKADGTASAGSESAYAAGDHVHPTDATRAPLKSPALTGTPTAPTAAKGTATTQIATTAFVKAAVDSMDAGVTSVAGRTGAVTLAKADVTDLDAATTEEAGLMSASDKAKLDGVETGAQKHVAPTKKEVTDALGYTPPTADTDTTYTLTQDSSDGHKITLTPSKGTATTITIPDSDTKALGSMTGTLGVAHGGTGASTLGAGVVYHAAAGTGALSTATAANLVAAIGTSPVARATADASGNSIADTYAKKSDVAGAYVYRGTVASASALPSSPSTGDVYNVEAASDYGPAGANVAWNGTAWDGLGGVFSVSSITNAQIDTICV